MTDPASPTLKRPSTLSVVGLPVAVFVILCLLALGSMQMLGAVRAYVGGESLWSKARATAVQHLLNYAESGIETELTAFHAALVVPDGDRQARLAIQNSPMDWARAKEGFIAGGSHPSDVDAMLVLLLCFGESWLFEESRSAWVRGDGLLTQLREQARHLQALALSPESLADRERATSRIHTLNTALLEEEKRFIASLNRAARQAEWLLQLGMVSVVALISGVYLMLMRRLLMRQHAHEVAEQTRAQLAIQRDAAHQVADSQRAFLSRLSHELRTPLNAILGFAQLLSMEHGGQGLSSTQKQQVHWILRAGQQLLALVEEVMDLSKVESGELRMRPQAVVLQSVLRDCLPLVDGVRQARRLHIDDQLPSEPLIAQADPQRLQQVFTNLLSNACKYNREGGTITLSARLEGDRVVASIRDSGAGLSAGEQAELFQAFKRVGRQAAEVEGTGLGLYIVRQLLHHMGGQVWVQSQPGEGSCFSVGLPRAPAQSSSSPASLSSPPSA
ncbi:MAG: HAMP domain-containing histidine kinase [Burkholderiales bacterium]|nr:HAMP domain-containing histidine kinase [Burkholderiales bacterium]